MIGILNYVSSMLYLLKYFLNLDLEPTKPENTREDNKNEVGPSKYL